MDANSQDVTVLIGSEDISKLDLYSEDDPRVLSLNGAFNVGNRGIVEFVEVFKNEIEFLTYYDYSDSGKSGSISRAKVR
jgi:serine protein kinase